MSTTQTEEARRDAAGALGAMSSTVHPEKIGIGGKIAIAGTVLRLVRRYPVAALAVGGLALAFYIGRRRGYDAVTRH